MASSMDGVMGRQLPRSCVAVSDLLQTPLPRDSTSGLDTEMHGITETTTPNAGEACQELDTTSDEISRTMRPRHLIEMCSV